MMRPSFSSLSTSTKLFLILSAAVLPLVLVLAWTVGNGLEQARNAQLRQADDSARDAARAIENLIARNALALRIAAEGALASRQPDPCAYANRSMAQTPGVIHRFSLRDRDGELLCLVNGFVPRQDGIVTRPGQISLWISPDDSGVDYRVGVTDGMATGSLHIGELRAAATAVSPNLSGLSIRDPRTRINLIERPDQAPRDSTERLRRFGIGRGQLEVWTVTSVPRLGRGDWLMILLPLVVWLIAAVLAGWLVHMLLIRPLLLMQGAVSRYQPGSPFLLPRRMGPSTEIRALGQSVVNAIDRVEESEREMEQALEGQRRLVREVHHRVKNNLQVVASLLNLHGRTAPTPDSREAYAAIGRRVDALAMVHRNHFADGEENRGIPLRIMLTELAAGLRASAPDSARTLVIVIEAEDVRTTQDAAVAVAFLVTELAEFAMFEAPDQPLEIELWRSGELSARLSLSSPVLVPDRADQPRNSQFERIMAGLARQLRSPLERKLGRYSVDVPVFPA